MTRAPDSEVVVGEVAEWAVKRAITLGGGSYYYLREAFARYIAAHEPAPVDPLREAIEAMRETARELRETRNGDCNQVQQAIMWERRADAVEAELRARLPQAALDALGEG